MSTHNPMGDARFVRPKLSFERELLTLRVAWLRDRRVVGLPLSVFLYLGSGMVDATRALSADDLGDVLGRSRDEVAAAMAELESAGYLQLTRRDGVIERFELVDPWGDEI